jgi:serine protease Do
MSITKRLMMFTVPAALAVVGIASMHGTTATVSATSLASAAPPTALPSPTASMDVNLFRNVAQQVNPVVVAIMTRSRVDTRTTERDELYRWFFGRRPEPDSRVQRALGSGFLISRDGDILTNNHVVADADVIEVGLFGDETKTHRARLIGRDPLSDSALIRLEQPPPNLPVATLGDSDAVQAGDWVMAIGNPFQLGHTVTVGVVSYIGRPFEVDEGRWQKMIQTDASINPGNSGGPLLNVRGEVVGINTAILGASSGGNIGIGFAVPIDSVKNLLPELRAGNVVHGRIGVQLRNGPVTIDEAKALGLPKAEGVIVSAVERGSPADRSGLQAGDVIVAFNGRSIANADDLIPLVSSARPGSRIALTVIRDGRERTLQVTVEELKIEGQRASAPRDRESGNFGMTLGDVTGSVASELRLPARMDGAVVYGVEAGSQAEQAGMHRGDVVVSINRQAVHNAGEAERTLRQIEDGHPAFLLVWRDGSEVLVEMQRES